MQLLAAAIWLHLLATVTLVGYYAVLALVVLPTLSRSGPNDGMELIAALERRAMPMLLVSLLVFLATGISLMTGDRRYAGLGDVNDAWGTLLLIKHVVIVGMLALGSYLDGLITRSAAAERPAPGSSVVRITWVTRAMASLGAIVLLLTAASQVA